jgi:hypothetical protein
MLASMLRRANGGKSAQSAATPARGVLARRECPPWLSVIQEARRLLCRRSRAGGVSPLSYLRKFG